MSHPSIFTSLKNPLFILLLTTVFFSCITTIHATPRICRSCQNNSQCIRGYTCHQNRCVQVTFPYASCKSHNQCVICPRNFKCAPDNKCRPISCGPCRLNSHCQHGQVCNQHKCKQPRSAGERCSLRNCDVCKRDYLCIKGRCQRKASPTNKKCKRCSRHSHCHRHYKCIRQRGRRYGLCKKYLSASAKCDFPCAHCKRGFHCSGNGRCLKNSQGHCKWCSDDKHCRSPLVCKIDTGKTSGKCAKPMKRGQKCTDPCWGCAKGLVCGKDKICHQKRNPHCGPCQNDDECQQHLVCKKENRWKQGKCAKPMKEGKSCRDPCWGCAKGLTCGKDKKCHPVRNPHCGPCRNDDNCQDPLVCKKEHGRKDGKCAKPMKEGQSCIDPCWGCAKGLECRKDKKCHPKRNPHCGPCQNDNQCQDPLVCKKENDKEEGKCAKPMKEGQSCIDPCWGCAKGLFCASDKKCKRRRLPVCSECKKDKDCDSNLRCKIGDNGIGKCAKLEGIGAPCSHKCILCKDRLRCDPKGLCTTPPKGLCGKCSRDFDCDSDLYCLRVGASVGRCTKRSSQDEPCGKFCKTCQHPLVCDKKVKKCKTANCKTCTSDSQCLSGHRCTTQANGSKQCSKIIKKNGKCQGRCLQCDNDLECINGFCNVPKKPRCDRCQRTNECEAGLHCGIDKSGKKKCLELLDTGKPCDKQCIACKQDLICGKNGKCGKPKLERCETCQSDAECEDGLSCRRGPKGRKRCSEKVKKDASCGKDCRYCSSGLECRNNKCQPPKADKCEECEENDDCEAGLTCRKTADGSKKCSLVVSLGDDCKSECHYCTNDLVCGSTGKCENPKAEKCELCQKNSDCEDGLKCHARPNEPRKCSIPAKLGGECEKDCYFCTGDLVCGMTGRCEKPKAKKCEICKKDTDCESGLECEKGKDGISKCSVISKLGGDCNKDCYLCANDLVCGKNNKCEEEKKDRCDECEQDGECKEGMTCRTYSDGSKKCSTPVTPGKPCNEECHYCTNDLVCGDSDKCEKPKSEKCEECAKDVDCKPGLVCRIGSDNKHKCSRIINKGGSCEPECDLCTNNLTCTDGTCQPPRKKKCELCGDKDICEDGFKCKQSGDGKFRCSSILPRGGKPCDELCNRCQDKLICTEKGSCEDPKSKKCETCRRDKDCESGLWCRNQKDGTRKCSERLGLGGNCNEDCYFCSNKFICGKNGKCRNPPFKRCDACAKDDDCQANLKCLNAPDGKRKCTTLAKFGAPCDKECIQCSGNMVCGDNGKCENPKAKKCEKCKADRNCESGLSCLRVPDGTTRCSQKISKGGNCSPLCDICAENLICGKNGKCRTPPSKKCDPCQEDSDCESGLKCHTGQDGKKRCTKTVFLGNKCSEECVICPMHLVCNDEGKCARPKVKKCGSCKKNDDCEPGLLCGIDGFGKRVCSTPLEPKQRCKTECATCPKTHTCGRLSKKCDERSIKCAHCFEDHDCLPGLICKVFTDGDGRGKCAAPMGVGAKCDDPCWACAKGLYCAGRYCAKKN